MKTRKFVNGSDGFEGRWFTFERIGHTELEGGVIVTTIRAEYVHGIYKTTESVTATCVVTPSVAIGFPETSVAVIDGRHSEFVELEEFGVALVAAWRDLV